LFDEETRPHSNWEEKKEGARGERSEIPLDHSLQNAEDKLNGGQCKEKRGTGAKGGSESHSNCPLREKFAVKRRPSIGRVDGAGFRSGDTGENKLFYALEGKRGVQRPWVGKET